MMDGSRLTLTLQPYVHIITRASREDFPGRIFPGGYSLEDIPGRIFPGGYFQEDIPRTIFGTIKNTFGKNTKNHRILKIPMELSIKLEFIISF